MVQNTEEITVEPLGDLFREKRETAGIELKSVSDETRIPLTTLKAIEADEFSALPHEPFAHGFYTIYAKFLGLDVDYIHDQYRKHTQLFGKPDNDPANLLSSNNQIHTMTDKPSFRLGSILGFALVAIIIIGGLISWSMDWNPASYLSRKIRSNSIPSVSTQKETIQEAQLPDNVQYHLQAYFPSVTKVTIIKDDENPQNYLFQSGDTRSWMAKENITMLLPEETDVRLTVNGLMKQLPTPEYGLITVKIPHH